VCLCSDRKIWAVASKSQNGRFYRSWCHSRLSTHWRQIRAWIVVRGGKVRKETVRCKNKAERLFIHLWVRFVLRRPRKVNNQSQCRQTTKISTRSPLARVKWLRKSISSTHCQNRLTSLSLTLRRGRCSLRLSRQAWTSTRITQNCCCAGTQIEIALKRRNLFIWGTHAPSQALTASTTTKVSTKLPLVKMASKLF
jgi:hypothetical protein